MNEAMPYLLIALWVIAVILFMGFYSVWSVLDDINDTLISLKDKKDGTRD